MTNYYLITLHYKYNNKAQIPRALKANSYLVKRYLLDSPEWCFRRLFRHLAGEPVTEDPVCLWVCPCKESWSAVLGTFWKNTERNKQWDCCHELTLGLSPKWDPIPYLVHYFCYGLWSKAVHYIGNRMPLGTQS